MQSCGIKGPRESWLVPDASRWQQRVRSAPLPIPSACSSLTRGACRRGLLGAGLWLPSTGPCSGPCSGPVPAPGQSRGSGTTLQGAPPGASSRRPPEAGGRRGRSTTVRAAAAGAARCHHHGHARPALPLPLLPSCVPF